MGIKGKELLWFKNDLFGRKQYVSINNSCSTGKKSDISIGVPQGSILGPMLFLIYINGLPKCSDFLALLFADDTTLLKI
jgi:ribonucleases P/MRP protein subunit RPP40